MTGIRNPVRFKQHEKVGALAVAQRLDGTISVSQLGSFVPNSRRFAARVR
jgi:hypothetical protein